MATVSKWTPFGVALDVTATASGVTRKSATQFTVIITASWETYYSGAQTNYGMTATSGGVTSTISAFDGTKRSSGSKTFTGTYSISGNGSATKSITVTFKNFNTDNNHSATKAVSFNVNVPAWTSYAITYNANGGSGAPGSQTKWKDQALTLSTTKPSRAGHTFLGWSTSKTATTATYAAGGSYTVNAAATLYAVWKANTYEVKFDANGGTGAPGKQTKTYGVTLKLSSTIPSRDRYNFLGWSTSASATTATYSPGGNYTANSAVTLYAVWSVAYVKPSIYNLKIDRCDANGNITDAGERAYISFSWKTTEANPTIEIAAGSLGKDTISGSGTSGSVAKVLSMTFSTDATYVVAVTVTDKVDSFTATVTLNGSVFPIDVKARGKGISFGGPAELDDTAEFHYDGKFNKPVYGKALGMDRLPAIPESADFNEYLDPGCFAVHGNAIAGTCANIPIARAGRLEVWSATGEGVRTEQYSYLRQRYVPYNSSNAVYERDVTRGSDNVWTYGAWWRSTLTPTVSEKVYSKAAMTIALSANATVSATGAYVTVPFNKSVISTSGRLTLLDNAIRIGSNISHVKISGQTICKFGNTAGNRHARIQKISGSTTTSVAWVCVYGTAASNTMYPFAPIIVPVVEGDLIKMVFYTADAADYNVAGSAANGWQTYMTVEEL